MSLARRTPDENADKVRLNLALSETVRRKMEDLKLRTDADSLTEVVRRALAVYDIIVAEAQSGNRILIDRAGEVVELRIT